MCVCVSERDAAEINSLFKLAAITSQSHDHASSFTSQDNPERESKVTIKSVPV